ncbi:M4 family metallopeptidase [Rhizohabitans arisaemae]|uniref:M4 family metallopeptidase n=1 Tax=Rhizohabitans arisaemae TaxID=2720610 RepID=UPI0024B0A2C3|nr:M4 family metallopeptidase [Rhizohabitans arisaemae]
MRGNTGLAFGAAITGLVLALSALPAAAAGPRAALGPASEPPDALAVRAADAFVQADPAVLFTSSEDVVRRLGTVAGIGGLRHVFFGRTHAGLPVHGGDFVVTVNARGEVLSTSVSQTKALDVPTVPRLTPIEATRIARALLPVANFSTAPELTVVAVDAGRLAYKVVVHGVRGHLPSILHVYVDALTGAVIDSDDQVRAGNGNSHYHGPVVFNTRRIVSTYSMEDLPRTGVRCGGQNGVVYSGPDDNWGNGVGTNLETACVDALYAMGKMWDMLSSWLNRFGVDANNRGFPIRVGYNDVTGYWNGSDVNFGRSLDRNRQLTSFDQVGHEFGHVIFQYTPGSFTGLAENGLAVDEKPALNESSADIFGALTEYYANESAAYDPPDFVVGEEVNRLGTGPDRYMYQPSLLGDADCYTSSVPSMEPHRAAGVQNHWFYLLAMGSAPGGGLPNSPVCQGPAVVGLGIQKAGRIFMEMLNRKTTTWSHARARAASLRGAKEVYAPSCVEHARVKAAWQAVGVGPALGEPACP